MGRRFFRFVWVVPFGKYYLLVWCSTYWTRGRFCRLLSPTWSRFLEGSTYAHVLSLLKQELYLQGGSLKPMVVSSLGYSPHRTWSNIVTWWHQASSGIFIPYLSLFHSYTSFRNHSTFCERRTYHILPSLHIYIASLLPTSKTSSTFAKRLGIISLCSLSNWQKEQESNMAGKEGPTVSGLCHETGVTNSLLTR